MKTNDKFKMIACVASVILIIIGIFVPRNISIPMEIIGMTTLFILSIIKWVVPSEKNTMLKLFGLMMLYLGFMSWVIPVSIYGETEKTLERLSIFIYTIFLTASITYTCYRWILRNIIRNR